MTARAPIGQDLNLSHEQVRLIVGDTRAELPRLPSNTFHCCVTSPPYWGLRDYGYESQIGAEKTVTEYIDALVNVFREVKRTLREDGTLWLNIGDSYTSGNRTWRDPDKKNQARGMSYRAPTPDGLKPKDLIGIPWRLAFALQADGWFLRSDIIWYKPNCQPESVKDRPTQSHEYLFLLSKSQDYYYDVATVREPTKDGRSMRNRRSVWEVNTEPYTGAHFAVFPKSLIRPCVLAGSPIGGLTLDPFFGSGTLGEVCIELGRQCVGIELKPEYADLARQRLRNIQLKLLA
jgi:site-specific DNA-methyltransferase (adenine-specific)/site-specific DNA-methyltransferase (cytosine-N4-specific)